MHGTGGPGYTIKAEFSERPHKRGTLSMARAGHPDSAGSQFFICVADARFLDKQYSVFGEVESGMDVVDKIKAVATGNKAGFANVPVQPILIKKATLEK